MDTKELCEQGLKLRREMFGEAMVDKRMNALGPFGQPLQDLINGYVYGDVWSRRRLPLSTMSSCGRRHDGSLVRPNELKVHLRGAVANGCTPEEVQQILLLVALYCGVPAANTAHEVAYEVLKERSAAESDARV